MENKKKCVGFTNEKEIRLMENVMKKKNIKERTYETVDYYLKDFRNQRNKETYFITLISLE